MNQIRFLWVGKLKEKFFAQACEHYTKKLSRFHKLEETIVKDAPSKLPPEQKSQKECEAILGKITPKDMLICLDETGKEMTSRELAKELQKWIDSPNTRPCFVIGGPFGLSDEIKKKCKVMISLSQMTLPHELARTTLLEQLYRAASINKGLPYHHD
ncbi:MAG: 23S rRNA (pseudouridine(1915)-N(3))-methyltransferase RlmH [Desulfovibrio sp.]